MSEQSVIGTDAASPALGDGHEILPVKGTLRRERDDVKPDYPIQPADYPLLADCICGALIRKEHYITGDWVYVFASDDKHGILPVRGTLRVEKTAKPPHEPILRRDYPIVARCACGRVIRKTSRPGSWEHVPVDTLIAEWARHPSRTRRLTAEIAEDMVIGKPRHTSLGTGHEIAATYDVTHSMVSKARQLLADLGMVYKSGNYYFVGQPPAEHI